MVCNHRALKLLSGYVKKYACSMKKVVGTWYSVHHSSTCLLWQKSTAHSYH